MTTITLVRDNPETVAPPRPRPLHHRLHGPDHDLVHQRSDILDYDPDGNSYLRRSVFRASSVDIRIAHLPETCDGEIRRLIHTALDPRTVDLSSLIHTVTDPQTWDVVGVAVCGAHLLPMYRPTCASSQWYACRACLELYRLLKDLREHQPILRHLASINQLAA